MAVVQGNGSVRSVATGNEVVMVQVLRLLLVLAVSVGNLRYDQGATAGKVRRAEGFCVAEGSCAERGGEDGVDSGRASAPHGHGTISLFPSAVAGCTGIQHDYGLADLG